MTNLGSTTTTPPSQPTSTTSPPIIPATPLATQDNRGLNPSASTVPVNNPSTNPPLGGNPPGSGAVARTTEVINAMPDRTALPQDRESQQKITTAVATNLVQQQIIDPNGRGSPNMQAAMGTGANSNTLFVITDRDSPTARVAPTDIVQAQGQSLPTLQSNLTAAVANVQPTPTPPGPTPGAPTVDQPAAPQGTRSL
ncbi:MAG: hypothetical protein IT473_03900 [Lysobacter sp.]|nr:hypothetical protein [Lysobacter sp.]